MSTVIGSDTTWTNPIYTDTSGYTIYNGATLTIDAVAAGHDINVIFGAGGSGNFVVEDDAKLILRTNDSYKIYMGGTSGSEANSVIAYGSFYTDFQAVMKYKY